MILTGPTVRLRPVAGDDVATLTAIRNETGVAAWWGDVEPGEIEEAVGDDHVFVIESDGELIGAIQYWEEDDRMYRHATIDLFLTTVRHGQGLGPEAIRVLARHLIEQRGHHRLTIDPAADNHAAIRAYEKVGFRRVGVMRRYERGPDGTWHDGVLMELLSKEMG